MAQDPLDALAAAWSLAPSELRALLEQHGQPASLGEAETFVHLPGASPAPRPLPAPGQVSDRYREEGLLGRGAMGEVHRVYDHVLARRVARKVIQQAAHAQPELRARFLAEARVTAQLQHPGVVPVYDQGVLPDGRPWFTMPEIRGRTLREAIRTAHADGPPDPPALRRLVEAFHRVCEAVAYAHGRGVVHRDLKPSNVMIGEHGEVLVLDWGVSKVSGAAPDLQPVVSGRSSEHATQVGAITGTPSYMAPEVALGGARLVDARTDVYSLGAVLYEILTGRAPYTGSSLTILQDVLRGPPPRLLREEEAAAFGHMVLPEALVAASEAAMAREVADRFPDAGPLARAIEDWLDGAAREAEGAALVAEAAATAAEAARRRADADHRAGRAEQALAELPPWAPESDKAPAWDLADAAAQDQRAAEHLDQQAASLLHAALTRAPRLTEAHAALAKRKRAAHEAAEARGAPAALAAAELRVHALALPADHPDRDDHLRWLDGRGSLDLTTDPPGAMARLYRYQPARRRLSPVLVGEVGPTPIVGLPIAHGSYVLEIRHPRCEVVRLPIRVGRGERWSLVPAGATAPQPVRLPRRGSLRADERFVPAGWFLSGGDRLAVHALPARRLWVDDWVVGATHVTNAQYIRFLDDLTARGRKAEAMRFAPRERPGTPGEEGALIYGFTGAGFVLRPDADGDVWEPEAPVLMVDHAGAAAYAAWWAARTGEPWQLLPELVWEKAARGVDGRAFPWGDGFDPTFACMRHSRPGRALPEPVGRYPVDESPYGIRDLAGLAATWCAGVWREQGPDCAGDRVAIPAPARPDDPRPVRGGTWNDGADYLRAARRNTNRPNFRGSLLSFRIGRPLL